MHRMTVTSFSACTDTSIALYAGHMLSLQNSSYRMARYGWYCVESFFSLSCVLSGQPSVSHASQDFSCRETKAPTLSNATCKIIVLQTFIEKKKLGPRNYKLR
eukprot:scpid104256/ scgid28134/ 